MRGLLDWLCGRYRNGRPPRQIERNHPDPGAGRAGWLLAQHPWIVPIPGPTKLHRLEENTDAAKIELDPADLVEITAAADQVDMTGDRCPTHMQRWINR